MDLLKCSFDPDQAGMFLWGKLPGNESDSGKFSDELLEKKGLFITPGFIFGINGKGYIRISLCSKNEILEEARQRVMEYLAEKQNRK